MFHIPKFPHLSIPEPPSNQILLTYFYLSEQFQKIQFELGDPVQGVSQWFEQDEMAIWQKNSHFAILALLSLCINFKNSLGQMTSYWVLWKTYYKLLLKKCLRSCLGPSMCLSARINWIISSFPHRISKILFVLGSWDKFECLGCRIGTGYFFWYLNFRKNTMHCSF